MQLPVTPPSFQDMFNDLMKTENPTEEFSKVMSAFSNVVDDKGRYLHWDKMRHHPVPEGFSIEQRWLGTKMARRQNYKPLPIIQDKQGESFQYCSPPIVQRQLHFLDRHASGSIQAKEEIVNSQMRNTYLIRSLIEEAISSSQLEGASTTQDVAKEMIRKGRTPSDVSEHMIYNNYEAMRFIRECKNELLTPSLVLELQSILTKNTLEDVQQVGRLRNEKENIRVVDNASHIVLHTPPPARELTKRMEVLCNFANSETMESDNPGTFLHPVIKAIVLHFMLGYDHPFCDGNGRTARALFYWAMAKHGYWLVEFISISHIIKQSHAQYGRSYLYTENDENDLTYFLVYQLEVIHEAIIALHKFLDKKMQDINEAEQMLTQNATLKNRVNFRQLALIRHALKNPRFTYVIAEHQNSHGISYEVARKDLLYMADELNLLTKTKVNDKGRSRYVFVAPENLEQRICKKIINKKGN